MAISDRRCRRYAARNFYDLTINVAETNASKVLKKSVLQAFLSFGMIHAYFKTVRCVLPLRPHHFHKLAPAIVFYLQQIDALYQGRQFQRLFPGFRARLEGEGSRQLAG